MYHEVLNQIRSVPSTRCVYTVSNVEQDECPCRTKRRYRRSGSESLVDCVDRDVIPNIIQESTWTLIIKNIVLRYSAIGCRNLHYTRLLSRRIYCEMTWTLR